MAHHDIIIKFKENKQISYTHLCVLKDFLGIVATDVKLCFDRRSIRLEHHGWFWCYYEDITDLITENKITDEMVEVYKWLKENTTLKSDCWNTCDNEYGPDDWDEVRKNIYNDDIELVSEFMREHNL